uniref:KIB1-4 beta-propeller domain-containing protein n=1 Tax=Arundo donax TaxID=35708 RepID=A0A0A9FBU6_ARUDO
MSPPISRKHAPGARIPCSSINYRRLSLHGGRPWASLPEDLVQLIGWRVLAGDLLDYVRFRAVCTHWNWSSVRPHGRGLVDPRFHPRRWMMLSEGHGLYPGHPHLGGYLRFFNLSTGVFVRVHLPLFDDHVVLDSVDGLLVLLLHRDYGTAIRLLHPFTGDIAELPPLLSLLPQMEPQARYRDMSEDNKLRTLSVLLRGVCAAVSVSATGAITVMLALDMLHHVAHASAGDQRWTLSSWELPFLLESTVSFQGKLYMVSPSTADKNIVYIRQTDPPQLNSERSHSSLQPPRKIAECPMTATVGTVHLVECGLELMLIGSNDSAGLVVYRLNDLISGRVAPVMNIGEHALFLGERSFYLLANKRFPSVLGNSIIRKHMSTVHNPLVRTRVVRRVEQYHLGSGTWSPAIDEEDIPLRDRSPPASPYMLIHHIYTCCYRSYWNKGLMVRGAVTPDWSVKSNLWAGLTDG